MQHQQETAEVVESPGGATPAGNPAPRESFPGSLDCHKLILFALKRCDPRDIRAVGGRDDARSIATLRVVEAWPQYDPERGAVSTFIVTVVFHAIRNAAVRERNERARLRRLHDRDSRRPSRCSEPSAACAAIDAETDARRDAILAAIDELPEHLRDAVRVCAEGGTVDYARRHGVSNQTVYNRRDAAFRTLRRRGVFND